MNPWWPHGGESLINDIAYGIERDAFIDDVGQICVRNAALGCDDAFVRGLIQNRVQQLRIEELFGHAVPFRLPRLCRGDMLLGYDWQGAPVPIWSKLLCTGLLPAGTTGGGKTGLLKFLAPQIPICGAAVWLFEMHKIHLRQLRSIFTAMGYDLAILQFRNLKFNPLHPHEMDPRVHLTTCVELLSTCLEIPERGQNILWQVLHGLFDRYGVWTARSHEAPCLFDVYEDVLATPGYNAPAREAILDRLGALLSFGQCFAYRVGWDPVQLEKFSIVFEMRGAPENVARMLIEPCLYAVFQDAYERGTADAPLSLVIALEDSLRLFVNRSSSTGKLPPLDEAAAVTRGSGITVWPIVQGVQGISRSLMANLNTKIMGLMGTHDDYQLLGADMRLSAEQLLWAKRNLLPGLFVAQINQGDWREPFVLRIPKLVPARHVDDAEAAASAKILERLPAVRATEYDRWKPHHLIEVAPTASSAVPHLTAVELRFLKLVVDEPGKPSNYYAKKAGLNGAAAAAARTKLVTLGLLREHSVATGRRGRMAIVLEPLEKAREVLGSAS